MTEAISAILIALCVLLLVPSSVLAAECLAALLSPGAADRKREEASRAVRLAVVIPAHNEELSVAATLEAIRPQLSSQDRAVVVADNCTDRTAELAEQAGAMVLRRNDSERRGKGYALDFALSHLAQDPPDAVVFIDADCYPTPGTIRLLAEVAHREQRPAQAYDEMKRGGEARTPGLEISEFAWYLRGRIRPLGLAALGMPCQLYGTGMALPWSILESVSMASGNIVEDMKLTLDLIHSGRMPLFCANAKVSSEFPATAESAMAQRKRWEHGHLSSIVKYGIPAAWYGLTRFDPRRLALALDICVPPLFLLLMLLTALLGATATTYLLLGVAKAAFVLSATAWSMAVASIIMVWWKHGRDIVAPRTIASLPGYVASKFSVYAKFFTDRQKEWNRADR